MLNAFRDKFENFRDQIENYYYDYASHLPSNIKESAVTSAIYSFAASVLLSGEVQTGLVFGALGAIASLIGALTAPIFHKFLQNHGQMKWYQQAAIIAFNVGLAHVAIRTLTTSRINVVATLICALGLNLFLKGFGNQYTSTNPNYVVV